MIPVMASGVFTTDQLQIGEAGMCHLKSNGFGSFKQLIAVRVNSIHVSRLLSLPGVKLLEERADCVLVECPLTTTRPNDDETVVYELRFRFAALEIPFEDWLIDWERTVY
jgi:hypothetical protein